MQTGFWNDFDQFDVHCWDYLEQWEIDNPTWEFGPYNYLHGLCDAFAQALNTKFHYPIWYVMSAECLVHAFCVKDQNIFVDIRGQQSDFEIFMDEFEILPHEIGPDGDFYIISRDFPDKRFHFSDRSRYIREANMLIYKNRNFYS